MELLSNYLFYNFQYSTCPWKEFVFQFSKNDLEKRIRHLSIPRKEEGVEHPTPECVSLSLEIGRTIFLRFGMLPIRVSSSKEGGIFFTYLHEIHPNRHLFIEVYNDNSIATLINDHKNIIYVEDIHKKNFLTSIKKFNKKSS